MKIDIIEPCGYCFGVKNAIKEALSIRKKHPNNRVFVLGELVHNKETIDYLFSKNIETLEVKNNNEIEILNSLNKEDILIFSAHGHKKEYEEILNKKGILFYDTTCLNVNKNFEIIKNSGDRGVIFIGKKDHPETKASLSLIDNIILYDINDKIDYTKLAFKEPVILNQTTLSFLELKEIHEDILIHFPNAKLVNEICPITSIRQQNIINLDDSYDLIIVIGSKNSSNTTKLYELAKHKHINKEVLFISTYKELFNKELNNFKKCAIFSGTSTSIETILEVKKFLEGI